MSLLSKLLSILQAGLGLSDLRKFVSTPDSRVRDLARKEAEETRHFSELSREEWAKLLARKDRLNKS